MKKTYLQPETSLIAIHTNVSFLAGSSAIEISAGKATTQDLGEAGVLSDTDTGVGGPDGGNLGKGNNIWDAWGE